MLLILGGTSATHKFLESVAQDNFIITVATDYGESEFSNKYQGKLLKIRFTEKSLIDFIKEKGVTKIIDTTHPYAKEITANAKNAAEICGIQYVDKVRSKDKFSLSSLTHVVSNYEEAVDFLKKMEFKNIFFTTGGNNIHLFSDFSDRSWVRVLPYEKSIQKCVEAGFERSKIIAMQGPFSANLNIAICREIGADCVVSKNGGEGSGFKEKVDACLQLGINLLVIEPPEEPANHL